MPARLISLAALIFFAATIGGCSHMESMLNSKSKTHRATNVMQFLYPKGNYQPLTSTTNITVPVNVGIAFVPESGEPGSADESPISEKQKARLLELVRQHFDHYEFIGRIEPIPTAYLRNRGGFDALSQASSLFNVDVMVLLSYDQIQFNDAKFTSLAYWTVVGLYVVHGDLNTSQTLLDAVVIDTKSRNMLFRAPGTSEEVGASTALRREESRREQAASGFRIATADLVDNLDKQLLLFRDRIKAKKAPDVQVSYREGYSGATGGTGAALAIATVALAWWRRKP